MRVSVLLLCAILTSCGASYHLKRAKHHVDKAIQKGAKVSNETIIKEVSIKVDSLHIAFDPKPVIDRDTVYYEKVLAGIKEPAKVRIIYSQDHSGVISAQPDVDIPQYEVRQDVPVANTTVIQEPEPKHRSKWFIAGAAFGALLVLLLMIAIRRI